MEMSRGVRSRGRTSWSWSLRPLRNVRIIHLSISFGAIKVHSTRTVYWHFRGVDACVKRITTPPRHIQNLIEDDRIFWVIYDFFFSTIICLFVCLFLTEINFEMCRKRNLRRAFPTAPGWGIRSAGGCWRHSAYQNCNTQTKNNCYYHLFFFKI